MELNYVSQEKGEAKTIAEGYLDKILFQFNLNQKIYHNFFFEFKIRCT